MAPGSANPMLSDNASDSAEHLPFTLNVFEGPEKKLELHFKSIHSQKCRVLSDCLPPSRSLRALSRCDIESILDAAACNILSVTCNENTDAYLLSESSLFVSDSQLTIKTCGTTRLLHALPVVLKLASEKLALAVTYVQFSRVSYLFPHAQVFPHDCFRNEVSFLNKVLKTCGQVFETSPKDSSNWHLYFAELDTSHQDTHESSAETELADAPVIREQHQALEIYMFDLDPSVMKLFMFGDRPHMIGTDNSSSGTTCSAGITELLLEDVVVDAFNFEPCGYSMNALHDKSYYTIHVSPEPDASYVSFETTAHHKHLPQLVTSVVKLFKPSRFTVALIENARAPKTTLSSIENSLSSSIMSKLLLMQSFHGEEPSVFSGADGCQAVVISFSSSESCPTVTSPVSIFDSAPPNGDINCHLNTVAASYGAHFIEKCGREFFEETKNEHPEESINPRFVVDLGRIAANIQRIHKFANAKRIQLRYPVRCNPDTAILTLLSSQEIWYEVTCVEEIQLLQNVGVLGHKMVLVTPVLTQPALNMFNMVGIVALFGKPSDAVLKALKQSHVGVEIRVGRRNVGDLETIVSTVLSVTTSICSIAVDSDLEKKSCEEGLDSVLRWLAEVEKRLKSVPSFVKETIAIQVGECLWSDMERKDAVATDGIQERMKSLLSHTPLIGIDVGRLVVENSVSLITQVIGRRCRRVMREEKEGIEGEMSYNYYVNDGVYGAFSSVIMQGDGGAKRSGVEPYALVNGGSSTEEHMSTIFGPTCDAIDRIWVGKLGVLDVGDRVLFGNMGAYSWCGVSGFNGFGRRFDTTYVVSRKSRGSESEGEDEDA